MNKRIACLVLPALGLVATLSFAADSSDTIDGSSPTTSATSTVTITTQPASVLVNAGSAASFTVAATGTGTLRYLWVRNGHMLRDGTSATLTLSSVSAADAGTYTAFVADDNGFVRSSPAHLDVNVVSGTMTSAPQDQAVDAGQSATFTLATSGTNLTYQWRHDGRLLAGETNASLTIANAGAFSDGSYSAMVRNPSGLAAIAEVELNVHTDARLTNISTRGHVGANDDQLIVGFVIRGTGSKKVLLRAVGPTLNTQFGVADALSAPKLTLNGRSHGTVVTDSNTAWAGGADLAAAFAQVGAFPLPAGSNDAALIETLDSGMFTANVTGVNGATGTALAEAYDLDTGSPSAELVNISARARVGAEAANTLIVGFTITGTTSDTVLIRGVGPSLSHFGLREALGASKVTLYDAKGNPVAVNSGWGMAANGSEDTEKEDDLDSANDRVGAFHLERGSHDSALLVTLAPGIYTAHVTGVNQSTGIAMAEIYEVR